MDLQSVRFFLGYGLIFFAQHVVTIVVVTVVLFVYSWQLALVALAITPVIVLTAFRYSRVSHPVLRDVQQSLGEVATVAEESITGVHVVKSFAQEERRAERFGDAADTVFAKTLAANRQRAVYVPLLTFLPFVAQALVLLVGGRMVIDGSMTLGAFSAFYLLLRCSSCRCGCSACGSARRSAPSPPASGSSRSSTSPRRSPTRPMRRRCPPAPASHLRGRLVRLRPRSVPSWRTSTCTSPQAERSP
jgi:ATP-binding cassette subfamily B protein